MKLLALDLDGVCNSDAWFDPFEKAGLRPTEDEQIDPAAVERLNRIVEATGCKIVISSTWRIGRSVTDLRDILVRRGFRHGSAVIGKTPFLGGPRGVEIQQWLNEHDAEDATLVILDDFEDMGRLAHRLVRTTNALGLLDEHAVRVVGMLNGTMTEMKREAGVTL